MSELLYAALRYAELGLRVFPVEPGGKVPVIKAWQIEATTDRDRIDWFWTRHQWREANIGLVAERFTVVDIDGKDGAESFKGLMPEGQPFAHAGPLVKTPKGYHLYYSPGWWENIRGAANHIDIRTKGNGYVLAPPSRTVSGEYRWVRPYAEPLPDPEEWLRAALETPASRVIIPGSGHRGHGERPDIIDVCNSLRIPIHHRGSALVIQCQTGLHPDNDPSCFLNQPEENQFICNTCPGGDTWGDSIDLVRRTYRQRGSSDLFQMQRSL